VEKQGLSKRMYPLYFHIFYYSLCFLSPVLQACEDCRASFGIRDPSAERFTDWMSLFETESEDNHGFEIES
jgi:hypothetical protein